MATVNGPLFSLDASGQLAKSLVYSKWKGKAYVREWTKPAYINNLQTYTARAQFGQLSEFWQTLTNEQRDSWQSLADGEQITAQNAFIKKNIEQLREGQPALYTPETTWTDTGGIPGSIAVYGGKGILQWEWANNGTELPNTQIYCCVDPVSGANARSLAKTTHIEHSALGDYFITTVTGVAPGTYYPAAKQVRPNGLALPWSYAEIPAIVT